MSEYAPVVAFFDMDKTILSESSGLLWVDYMRRTGRIALRHVLYVSWLALQYKLAVMDYAGATARLMPIVAGQGESEIWTLCREWFGEVIVPRVMPSAVQRIEEHRRAGHLVAVLSAATVYVVKLLAEYLGLGDDYICTYLQVQDGQFTGRVVEPSCYGANKVYWARKYAADRGADLAHAYFYTDSHSDVALLEQVGHPVAVNPDLRLGRLARRRGWPVERFH